MSKRDLKELEKAYPILKPCGCIILGSDGSKIACPRHTSRKLKKLAEESIRVA